MLAFFSHRFAHMNDTTQLVTKGERHCGTNLLTEVLKLTFGAAACPGSGRFVDSGRTCAACTADLHAEPRLPPDRPAYCCWKHGYADARCAYTQARALPHVFVVRSPYPWLLAMHAESYERFGELSSRMKFGAFVRARFEYTAAPYSVGGIAPESIDKHANPVQLWNAKLRSYVALLEARGHPEVWVRFRSLYERDRLDAALVPLDDAHPSLAAARRASLARAGGAAAAGGAVLFPSFAADNRSNDKFDGGFTRDGFEAARAYEAAERWRERLSDDDLAFINGELDAGLMAYFGFDFVNGSSASARRPPRRHASVQLALLPTAAAPRLDAAEHRRLLSFLS